MAQQKPIAGYSGHVPGDKHKFGSLSPRPPPPTRGDVRTPPRRPPTPPRRLPSVDRMQTADKSTQFPVFTQELSIQTGEDDSRPNSRARTPQPTRERSAQPQQQRALRFDDAAAARQAQGAAPLRRQPTPLPQIRNGAVPNGQQREHDEPLRGPIALREVKTFEERFPNKQQPKTLFSKDNPFADLRSGWWSESESRRLRDRTELSNRPQPRSQFRLADDIGPMPGYTGHMRGMQNADTGKAFSVAVREVKQKTEEERQVHIQQQQNGSFSAQQRPSNSNSSNSWN